MSIFRNAFVSPCFRFCPYFLSSPHLFFHSCESTHSLPFFLLSFVFPLFTTPPLTLFSSLLSPSPPSVSRPPSRLRLCAVRNKAVCNRCGCCSHPPGRGRHGLARDACADAACRFPDSVCALGRCAAAAAAAACRCVCVCVRCVCVCVMCVKNGVLIGVCISLFVSVPLDAALAACRCVCVCVFVCVCEMFTCAPNSFYLSPNHITPLCLSLSLSFFFLQFSHISNRKICA